MGGGGDSFPEIIYVTVFAIFASLFTSCTIFEREQTICREDQDLGPDLQKGVLK